MRRRPDGAPGLVGNRSEANARGNAALLDDFSVLTAAGRRQSDQTRLLAVAVEPESGKTRKVIGTEPRRISSASLRR